MKKYDVIVVGAGAAGLFAAGAALLSEKRVLLIEKMERPARKLRISGKGRCNLSNTAPLEEFMAHFGKNGLFLRDAFKNFFTEDLINLLSSIGIETVSERGGRIFPKEGRAQDVVDTLVNWVKKNGATIISSSRVKNLTLMGSRVSGVLIDEKTVRQDKREEVQPNSFIGEKVILATGGSSYPLTGSTGDGYEMAKKAGHNIIPIRGVLVPLITVQKISPELTGLKLKNINAKLLVNGKKISEEFGELEFLKDGLGGPIILSLSALVADALLKRDKIAIAIDLKPALDEEKLEQRLLRDLKELSVGSFMGILKGLLPEKLINYCSEETKIPLSICNHQISKTERLTLRNWLKNLTFDISGTRPLSEALVTAGGVDLKEVDPKTMESRIIKNLYFAGEILDLAADTGGFNLQAAFSTGWLAGNSASKEIQKDKE